MYETIMHERFNLNEKEKVLLRKLKRLIIDFKFIIKLK